MAVDAMSTIDELVDHSAAVFTVRNYTQVRGICTKAIATNVIQLTIRWNWPDKMLVYNPVDHGELVDYRNLAVATGAFAAGP
jgi:hypothetical protein